MRQGRARTLRCAQGGAALLMALLTVALVATLASAALWRQWRNVEVEAHDRSRMQAGWVLSGALDWARLILREDARAGGPDHLGEPWSVPLQESRLSTFLAIDPGQGKVYFSDFEVANQGKIWRMNLDGTGLEAIVTGINDPYGVDLDLTNGKVYWADDAGNISRANLDGSSPQIGIVNISGGLMRAVSLDPASNKMYFYEVDQENLYVANLDGSNPAVLIPGVYGYAILVDTQNDKIYYDDQNANGGDGALMRANLDGSGAVNISDVATRIYGMAIDYTESKIYWSGRDSGALTRANLDGSSPEVLKNGLASPRGIMLKL